MKPYLAACLCSALTVCSAFVPTVRLHAEDLRDIANSATFKQIARDTHREALNRYRGGWVTPGENYSKLFAYKGAVRLVDAWLGTSKPKFKLLHERARAIGAFVHLGRTYESSHGKDILMDVLIPHPRHVMQAENGLIDEFRLFEPPMLPVESKEEVDIQGRKAMLFEKKDGRCSLLIKSAKGSVINIDSVCSEQEDVLGLARELSLDRFEQMLNT